jgi:hypothetical protein
VKLIFLNVCRQALWDSLRLFCVGRKRPIHDTTGTKLILGARTGMPVVAGTFECGTKLAPTRVFLFNSAAAQKPLRLNGILCKAVTD